MAVCELCEKQVNENKLVETDFGNVCPECEGDLDFQPSTASPLLFGIIGALGAFIPMIISISRFQTEMEVGHFTQSITGTRFNLLWTSIPAKATWFVDWVAVMGGILATGCGVALFLAGLEKLWKKLGAALCVLVGLGHLLVGFRFFLF